MANSQQISLALNEKLTHLIDDDTKLYAALSAYKYMYPYIPFVTGMLANTVDITPGQIRFKVPYAMRQYYGDGFNFTKDMHPLACARWGEVAVAAHGTSMAREIEHYLKLKIK